MVDALISYLPFILVIGHTQRTSGPVHRLCFIKDVACKVAWMGLRGHFTHEPRAVTMTLWEPKRKCPRPSQTHLQNHVVWSRTLQCSVKLYVIGPSIKCHFNEFLFMWVLINDKVESINDCACSECHGLPFLCWAYLQVVVLKIGQVTMKRDPFDAM